jgi:hypothetical protein
MMIQSKMIRRHGLCVAVLLSWAVSAHATFLADLAKPQAGRSMRESSTHRIGADGKYDPNGKPDPDSNSDNKSVPAGQTKILMDREGPGAITHIWITFLGPEAQDWAKAGSANHQEMLLRMTWDDQKTPSVEAPVGDFFACGFGIRTEIISLPVAVEDADSYNCFWRMPFRKHARIEIVNQSDKPLSLLYYNIDWIKYDSLPDETPYFYARYRQEYPNEQGKDYLVLDTQGKGHYVGTVLSVRTRSPSWFGEGDEKIYIDGEKDASIWGTGTEDYFLSAWGLKKTSTPYFGVGYFDEWGIVGGHTCAYRWHIQDPIVFSKGIRVSFEHYGWISPDENPKNISDSWNQRQDDYSSVAFWYQTGTPTFNAPVPHAKDRKLPNLDRIIYANGFTDAARHGKGNASTQTIEQYDQAQLLYQPTEATDAWVEIPFTVEKKEPKRLLVKATTSYDFGIYQISLNGIKLGEPVDLYSGGVNTKEIHLLDFWPEPGEYKLRLECVGKNGLSKGYYLGLESVRLRERRPRVVEYGFDKDKDWKKNPTLYR